MSKDLSEVVDKMARLSRIEITKEERTIFASSLSSIIDYFDLLKTVNTAGITPDPMEITPMILRDDIPEPPLSKKAFLKEAPSAVGDLIRVPQVLKPS